MHTCVQCLKIFSCWGSVGCPPLSETTIVSGSMFASRAATGSTSSPSFSSPASPPSTLHSYSGQLFKVQIVKGDVHRFIFGFHYQKVIFSVINQHCLIWRLIGYHTSITVLKDVLIESQDCFRIALTFRLPFGNIAYEYISPKQGCKQFTSAIHLIYPTIAYINFDLFLEACIVILRGNWPEMRLSKIFLFESSLICEFQISKLTARSSASCPESLSSYLFSISTIRLSDRISYRGASCWPQAQGSCLSLFAQHPPCCSQILACSCPHDKQADLQNLASHLFYVLFDLRTPIFYSIPSG
jgi:hypothetical protein